VRDNRIFTYGCMVGFQEAVEGHTAGAACHMLKILGYGDSLFWWVGASGCLYPWTPAGLLGITSRRMMNAIDVSPIEFIGGPYGNGLYTGTLLTYLVDCMLRRTLTSGMSPIRAIEHILWDRGAC